MISIEISNLDKVIATCLKIANAYDGIEEEVSEKWAAALNAVCQPACPVDTGYMKSCLHAEISADGKLKGFWYGIRDADCYYAKFVEFAWGGRNMWFRPAVDSVKKELADIYRQALIDRIEGFL